MTIAPTVSFSFVPTCNKFSWCCCGSSTGDDDVYCYPTKKGEFRTQTGMSSKQMKVANRRFKEIIARKLEPLPLDTKEFIRRLEQEEGIDFEVTKHCPLTKERVEDTVQKINAVLRDLHI